MFFQAESFHFAPSHLRIFSTLYSLEAQTVLLTFSIKQQNLPNSWENLFFLKQLSANNG